MHPTHRYPEIETLINDWEHAETHVAHVACDGMWLEFLETTRVEIVCSKMTEMIIWNQLHAEIGSAIFWPRTSQSSS